MLGVVPWDSEKGDTSMWRYPKNKCKGVLHVSCFAYGENAFHGKGIYAVDAVTWLSYVRVPFNMKRLDVVPVLAPGSEALSLFGYGSDGAMVSSTILCALVALVLYAVDTGVQMSDTIVEELNGGNVQYVKHASGMERLVANMVTSNVISKINRSMDDPLLLAADIWAILIDHHPGNPIGPEGVHCQGYCVAKGWLGRACCWRRWGHAGRWRRWGHAGRWRRWGHTGRWRR